MISEIDRQIIQAVHPLLKAEIVLAAHGEARRYWQHLDAMNVFGFGAEPRCQFDLVLKEDAGDMILGERRRVVRIVALVQKVFNAVAPNFVI